MDRQPFLDYKYLNSHSVPVDVQVGISRLELPMSVKIADHADGEFVRVLAKVISDHQVMFHQDIGTYHGFPDEFRNALVWDYVVSLPIKIQNLSHDALLVLTAYRADGSVYGGTSMTFYDENGLLKQGKQKLVFFFGREGDSTPIRELNSTPGDLYYSEFAGCDHGFRMEKKLESYKVVMMRTQNSIMAAGANDADPSNANSLSRLDLANDYGMVRQLGLGCGLSQTSGGYGGGSGGEGGLRLDWLDRMVLTQIQHTVGVSLIRDRDRGRLSSSSSPPQPGAGAGAGAGAGVGAGAGDAGAGEEQGQRCDNSISSNDESRELALLKDIHAALCPASADDDGDSGGGSGVTAEYAPPPLERQLEDLSLLVVELPLLAHPVVHHPREYTHSMGGLTTPHAPPRSEKEMLRGGFINDAGLLEFTIANRHFRSLFDGREIGIIADWDADTTAENLAEEMSRKLSHSSKRERSGATTKPNREQLELLQRIVDAPHGVGGSGGLTGGEKDLLYIYRYSLTDNKKALTKVLQAIDWDKATEVAEVRPLLQEWRNKAPIDVAEALKLLGKEVAFQDMLVRGYAVEVLDTASDEEVALFLLQLVQALRYEPRERERADGGGEMAKAALRASEGHFSDDEGTEEGTVEGDASPGKASTITSSSTEGEGEGEAEALNSPRHSSFAGTGTGTGAGFIAQCSSTSAALAQLQAQDYAPTSPLARFLVRRACASRAVACRLYWYLKVETESDPDRLFTTNFYALLVALASGAGVRSNPLLAAQLIALDKWINNVTLCHRDACSDSLYKPMFSDKYALIQDQLNTSLVERGLIKPPEDLLGVPHPFDPRLSLVAVVTCSKVFRSAMKPCVIDTLAVVEEEEEEEEEEEDEGNHTWRGRGAGAGAKAVGEEGREEDGEDEEGWGMSAGALNLSSSPPSRTGTQPQQKGVIAPGSDGTHGGAPLPSPRRTLQQRLLLKQGDDLRTDQLILNLFSLMDSLLKRVNLDLRMRMYSVLATSQEDGAMEFVGDSAPVQYILDTHGKSIRNYLRRHNPDPSSPSGIAPEALDTFIRSCAGSCVTTYILGIGDRHLDNIMITTSGQLFHIDFGFVFGKDPKPLPSPFRLTREMAVAIGGENYQNSDNFNRFKALCFQSYNWLRRSSNLIMNLLSLLNDDTIKSGGAPMAVPDVLKVVEDRLMLHLTEEEAEAHFQSLIDSAISAIMPQIVELAHILAMKMK